MINSNHRTALTAYRRIYRQRCVLYICLRTVFQVKYKFTWYSFLPLLPGASFMHFFVAEATSCQSHATIQWCTFRVMSDSTTRWWSLFEINPLNRRIIFHILDIQEQNEKGEKESKAM